MIVIASLLHNSRITTTLLHYNWELVAAVINCLSSTPSSFRLKASKFHYLFVFYFWIFQKKNGKILWEMKGRVKVRQLCHYNSFGMMTRVGNELLSSIFFFLRTLFNYGFFFCHGSKCLFQFWQIFFLLFVSVSPHSFKNFVICFGIKVINFSSLSASDRLWRNCRFQQFLMRKLSYCFANNQIFCFFGGGSRMTSLKCFVIIT